MNIRPLVKMANEIGAFFHAGHGDDEAARLIADHLKRFWDPRMRREIIAHAEAGGAGLTPTVLSAVRLLAGS